jgi:hypothetical protein
LSLNVGQSSERCDGCARKQSGQKNTDSVGLHNETSTLELGMKKRMQVICSKETLLKTISWVYVTNWIEDVTNCRMGATKWRIKLNEG